MWGDSHGSQPASTAAGSGLGTVTSWEDEVWVKWGVKEALSELHSGPKTALHSNGNDNGSLVQVRTVSCSSGQFSAV